MHFLTGYLWNLVWTWAFDATLPVLNLAILVVVACIFEVFENQDGNTFWIWRFCGYEEEEYTGDTALNSAMDVLLSVAGWGAVQGVAAMSRSAVALGLLIGIAAMLFALFLLLLRFERKMLSIPQSPATLPALLVKSPPPPPP